MGTNLKSVLYAILILVWNLMVFDQAVFADLRLSQASYPPEDGFELKNLSEGDALRESHFSPAYRVTAKIRVEGALHIEGDGNTPYGVFSDYRAGLFLSEWWSFHGRAHTDYQGLKREETNLDVEADLTVIQIGNLATHSFRFVVGRAQLPLGINQPVHRGWYERQFSYDLYRTPMNSVQLAFDNQENVTMDVGLAVEKERKSARQDAEPSTKVAEELLTAISLRLIYDFPILGSTRSIVSAYSENSGKRRWGLGLLTVGDKKEETHFEVIRELATPDGKGEPFKQSIRFGFKGAVERGTRWSFQIDDEIDRMTTGLASYEVNLVDRLWVNQGLGYRRGRRAFGAKGWYLLAGFGTTL
jgi:hypothetical protein